MATEAQNMPMPHACLPLSYLGPSNLSCFTRIDQYRREHSVFWTTDDGDELLRCHQRTMFFASNNGEPTMKEKIKCALQGVDPYNLIMAGLVQFWGLVNIEDSWYLTTCDQPFALARWLSNEKDVEGLCRYRKHCLEYLIAVDETNVEEGELGPPGRVFCSGLPEYVSDVSHYSSEEYPQRDFALQCVKSYWALPVYQSPGNICIGVLEFLSSYNNSQILWKKYLDWFKKVGLTTNCSFRLSDYKKPSSCYDGEINKIAEALEMIYKTHGMLVVRAWIEANFEEQLTVVFEKGFRSSFVSLSTGPSFYFIQKGHGVVGKAFSSQSACFCTDIRQLSITEYPFVPNARKYGFSECFAICLRSSCSNSCIYTLEFILPKNRTYSDYHSTLSPTNETIPVGTQILLHMIMETLTQHLRSSFKIAPRQELGQNHFIEVLKVSSDVVVEVHDINVQENVIGSLPTVKLVQNVASIIHAQPIEELNAAIPARDDATMEHEGNARDDDSMERNGNKATNLRKRSSGYTLANACGITREVLEQHSAMKRVDAAKTLGISISTLKRTCRQYGILRWPPRKARKFNQAINQEIAQPRKKSTGEHSMSTATGLQDESCILVKATYEGVKIWFELSLSAQKMDLDEKVATRFNLPIGSFRIMYLDEEEQWVSITCDEDLSLSLSILRSVGKPTMKMLVCS